MSVVSEDATGRRFLLCVTAYSSTPPESGMIGDDQIIYIHFEKVGEKPNLKWDGVPQLC